MPQDKQSPPVIDARVHVPVYSIFQKQSTDVRVRVFSACQRYNPGISGEDQEDVFSEGFF
jgi:hypothetical protein